MPQMDELMYDKLFESEIQTDRLEQDPGEDDGYDASSECQVKHVIPFPHEFHPLLTKEEIHIFKADVVFDLAVGSGYRLLAVIEMNLKGVGCCRNQAQKEWVYSNLVRWVREKRLVNFIPPTKPPEIIEYERRNLNNSCVSSPSLAVPNPTATLTPSPAPAQSQIPTTPVAGPRSLLSAFGGIAM